MKTTNVVRPEAYIAVGKNRQKINGENTVYLSDKQEFSFELFNPTPDNIMAKISINGNLISNRGLIIRPGMRGFLERYIDENKKFLFETYIVDGESKAVQKAIADNGDIKIEFFREKKIKTNFKGYLNITTTNSPNSDYVYYRNNIVNSKGSVSTYNNDSELSFNTNSLADYAPEEMSRGFCSNFCHSIPDTLSKSCDSIPEKGIRGIVDMQLSRKKLSKNIETGRIEKGSVSGQEFKTVDMQFEYMSFFSVYYKLMPISQKPAEFNEMKLKCACGAKIKSNWKVCPICGQPINNEEKCKNCGTKIEPAWNFCPTCNNKLK